MKLAPSQEDWDAWKEHPITRLVMQAMERIATEAEAQWKRDAWSNEYLTADGRERQLLTLNRVKAHADGLRVVAETKLEDVIAVLQLRAEAAPEEGQ